MRYIHCNYLLPVCCTTVVSRQGFLHAFYH